MLHANVKTFLKIKQSEAVRTIKPGVIIVTGGVVSIKVPEYFAELMDDVLMSMN